MKQMLTHLRRLNPRLMLAALFSIAVLHVATTFAAPRMAVSSAWDRLAPALKANTMVVLPPITPEAQPLPYLAPDARIAICLFDTRNGKVTLTASLPGPGWTLTLYDRRRTAIYSAIGRPDRPTAISLLLVPDDDRFLGLTPEAQGLRSPRQNQLQVQARKGFAVLRAPDAGHAYRALIEAELMRATCRKVADKP